MINKLIINNLKNKGKIIIKNLKDLNEFGSLLIKYLKPNIFLLLSGPLGSGKTALVKILGKKLGIKDNIKSPTFLIHQRYCLNHNLFLNHFDFFYLKPVNNLNSFKELTSNNINVIEWPENNPVFYQNEKYIKLTISIENNNYRNIIIEEII